MIAPVSTPVVHQEQRRTGHLHAVREGVGRPVHARERRQQRRVGVDVAAGEAGQERRSGQLHEPGGDHQVRLEPGHDLGDVAVPGGPVGRVGDPPDERRDARPLGPGQSLDPGRSAPTATTCAPYDGSWQASSSACRFVPAPETSTTRRAGSRGRPACVVTVDEGIRLGSATIRRWVIHATAAAPNASSPASTRPTRHGDGPTSANAPGPAAPPLSAISRVEEPGRQRRRGQGGSNAGRGARVRFGRRACNDPPAEQAADDHGTSTTAHSAVGSGPGAGTAPRAGTSGSSPRLSRRRTPTTRLRAPRRARPGTRRTRSPRSGSARAGRGSAPGRPPRPGRAPGAGSGSGPGARRASR